MLNEKKNSEAKTVTATTSLHETVEKDVLRKRTAGSARPRSLGRALLMGAGLGVALAGPALGCDSESEDSDHENDAEIISRVELTFSPNGGGEPVVVSFTDPDGDGGMSGVADELELAVGTEYSLSILALNELVEPPVDITEEVREEAEEHLFFVVGEGVAGPGSASTSALVTHAYADRECDYGDNAVGEDLPLGLSNTITVNNSGEGQLRVMLRHLPELNGRPQKRAGLPEALAAGESLPGDVDVDVTFNLTVP